MGGLGDYLSLSNAAATFQGLIDPGAFIRRGEGERAKESAVVDFHQAMQWLREEAERAATKQRYEPKTYAIHRLGLVLLTGAHKLLRRN